MAWTPIQLTVPQYVDTNGNPYSGAVLKAYSAGTSTNTSMATDSTGATTFTSIALNANGYPSHSGSICIPHIDQTYKLALYATQAAADANTPAIWSIDNLTQVSVSGTLTTNDAVSNAVTNVITATHSTTGTPVTGIGTGIAMATETAVGNTETGLVLEAVTTDITAGSEDFDAVLKLMAAGAAATERLRITSAGALTLKDAAAVTLASIASTGAVTLKNSSNSEILTVSATGVMAGFTAIDIKRATVVSHATTADIWSVGNQIDWTGTATTTAFPTAPRAGTKRELICADACSFTAGANMLIAGVASGSTVTCAANDIVEVHAISTTQFHLTRKRYDGKSQNPSIPIIAAGGTVDAITATYVPAITLSDKQLCMFVGAGANTSTTPTFAPNGLTAHTITTSGGQALVAGNIGAAGYVGLLEYNLANTRWELLNPVAVVASPTAGQGASMVLLSTVTASNSATVDVETTFDSTYDKYVIEISGLTVVADGAVLRARMKIGGSYLSTSTYYYRHKIHTTSTATYSADNVAIASATTEIALAPSFSNAASASAELTVTIENPASTAFRKKMRWSGAGVTTTSFEYQDLGGVGGNTGTGALTGIRFLMSSNNILAGSFRLYGIKNS